MTEVLNEIVSYTFSGGWLIVILFLCALAIWALYFYYLFLLREKLRLSDIEQFIVADALVTSHSIGATARSVEFVNRSVEKGVDFREAFEISREAEVLPFFGGFKLMAALVAAAPLLGLLGTVSGMILTFAAITGPGDPETMVASGISKALITTQAGLAVAIPGAFALVHLRRRYRHLVNVFERNESRLAVVFYRSSESKNEKA